MSGIEFDDYQLLQPYFTLDVTSEDTEFPAAMGYFRGSIEEPNFKNPSTAMIILFPQKIAKGKKIPFALDRWNKDHPPQSTATTTELEAAYVPMPGRERLMAHYAFNPVSWSKPIEVPKPSFGKGISIPPPKELLPTSIAAPAQGKSSKRKRQGQQGMVVDPPVSLHSILHSSTTSALMVQSTKKPQVVTVPSAAAVVAQKHSAVVANSSVRSKGVSVTPTAVVTKQAGDALVAQDAKIDMAIAGLHRVEQAAIADRASTQTMFAYICERLEKMDSTKGV
jgi:hypothetical protein